jgi:uncharacterized FAD-dependent dehydrogenase
LDARGRRPPTWSYRLGVELSPDYSSEKHSPWQPVRYQLEQPLVKPQSRPIVVGAGPAGLFAALRLCSYGLPPLILERGKPIEERARDVATYWRTGTPDPESNIQFGEGGAGAFSDGKLTSRSKDFRKQWVLEKLVEAGGPASILFDSRPHLGTDKLRTIVANLRKMLISLGAEFSFGQRVEGLLTEEATVVGVTTAAGEFRGGPVFLATGHSARDVYELLAKSAVELAAKDFAVGLRVETSQKEVNLQQYGQWTDLQGLPPAEFSLTRKAPDGRGVFSFCMCPGGVVIPSGVEGDGLVINGMSGSRRSSRFANSALVVQVRPGDFGADPLKGLAFQRDYEKRAFALAGPRGVPASTVKGFVTGTPATPPESNCPWPLVTRELGECLPDFVAAALRKTMPGLIKMLPPLATATLMGVETRTSSPVRITRGAQMEAISTPGLYPVGEGAGYAGGIISCAVDGAKSADGYAKSLGGDVRRLEES